MHLGVPVGCVATSVPGTNIELWSSTEALAKCPYSSADHGKAQPNWSALWEGMVAPLTRMSVKGFLWYQVRYPFLLLIFSYLKKRRFTKTGSRQTRSGKEISQKRRAFHTGRGECDVARLIRLPFQSDDQRLAPSLLN